MATGATAQGLEAASRNKRLAATLWLFNLALALAAAVPAWRALDAAIGLLPAADSLAEAFSFGVLADLTELRPGLLGGLGAAAAAVFALGLLVGLVASGGSLEVLTSSDDRPFAHRFGRGAFRFFARFLRLGATTLVVSVLLAILVAGPLLALHRYVRRESGSEWLALAVLSSALAAAGLVVLLALLVQDAARVLVVRGDLRRVLPALRSAMALVFHHPGRWLGAWAANVLLLGVAFAAYLALANAIPAGRALVALVALVLLQQLFVLVRCHLRVALLGAQVARVPRSSVVEPPPQPSEPWSEPPVEPLAGPSADPA
jgi:hypothetical protein